MNKVRRIGLSAIMQYNYVSRKELNAKSDIISDRRKKKIEKLSSTNCGTKDISNTVEGVVIDDESLQSIYCKVNPKPAIYGGIQATGEMKEFLSIPSGFRTFGRIEILNEEVRSEESATHQSWKYMSGEECTPHEMRDQRDN